MSALPNGWTQAALLNLATLNPKTDEQDSVTCGFAPMQALGTSFRTPLKFESRPWGDVKKAYTHFKNGDVLMAKVTPCFENGKAGIAANLPNGIGAGSSEFFVIRPSTDIDARYLLGWLSTEAFRKRAAIAMTGSVGLKRVPKDLLQTEVIPVAPAAEQKRIADKLDTVLTRVDAVNTRLARVAPLLKRFRQSVLAAATTGRLTEDWRSNRSVAAAKIASLGSLVESIDQGWSPKCESNSALPDTWSVMKTTAIQPLVFSPYENKALPKDLDPRQDLTLKDGDVLITRAGPRSRAGITCLVKGDHPKLILCDKAYRLRVNLAKIKPAMLNILLNSPTVLDLIDQMKTGISESGMNLTQVKFRELSLLVPHQAEQTEIVRRVETLFAFADRLEARLAQAQTAATRLTPALLAKAFHGELVPQDPNDEPAAELLRRLAQAPAAASPRRGRKAASATA